MAQSETKQPKMKLDKRNQIETVSDVKIPLEVVYASLSQYIDGDAQSASVKGGGDLVINVLKHETVAS